jgi:uncharacterized membrane protein
MKSRNVTIISIFVVGVLLLIAGYFIGQTLGPTIATHWNAAGEADGYGSPFMGLYFLPLLTMGLSLLIIFMPEIDPLKANVAKFRPEYNLFILAFAAFMYYIHGLSLAWNMGLKFSMNGMMAPALGIFFILSGITISKAKRNYFIGIRTPWTLANDVVWERTHQLGGKLFIASGVLTLACVFCPGATMFVLLVTALGSALIAIVYSYFEFRKIEKLSGNN